MLTPEREKEIRECVSEDTLFIWQDLVKDLLTEIERLRWENMEIKQTLGSIIEDKLKVSAKQLREERDELREQLAIYTANKHPV